MERSWFIVVSGLAVVIGIVSGAASALLLESLRWASETHQEHPWLLFGLPLAGIAIAWAYSGYGQPAAGGNNLLLDQIHAADQVNRVPLRMFVLVLWSTVVTHLFGGSAGREGTAVQMGGAFASYLSRLLRFDTDHLRVMLMCGVSGGFAGVFGTPLAGTVFGMEVIALGGMRYGALIPCLIAAVTGDLTVRALDIPHAHYAISTTIPAFTIGTVLLVALAGVAFGGASLLFSEAMLLVERTSRRLAPNPMVRAFAGGILVVLVTLALGTRMYSGLSLPLLSDAFTGGPVPTFAFLVKIGLTALTLGVGFKGGEVTPLFVIGATLGVTLASPLGLEPDFLAALGFVAVFAAAANTPIACVVMGAELFSTTGIIYVGIAVFIAYTISGHRGIYHAQRIVSTKYLRDGDLRDDLTVHAMRHRRHGTPVRARLPRRRHDGATVHRE